MVDLMAGNSACYSVKKKAESLDPLEAESSVYQMAVRWERWTAGWKELTWAKTMVDKKDGRTVGPLESLMVGL